MSTGPFFPYSVRRCAAVFFLFGLGSFAFADMELTITDTGTGVQFCLQGSLDVSAINQTGTAFATFSQFTHTDGGSAGSGTFDWTQLISNMNGLNLIFPDDMSLTPIGNIPAGTDNENLSVSSPFYVGYVDYVSGATAFNDSLRLPIGYTSGSTVNMCFTDPAKTLSDFALAPGDFWGVSFADSNGDTQTMTFNVVPEPDHLVMLLITAAFGMFLRRRR